MSSIKYEKETVEKMIGLYCSRKHGTDGGLCAECEVVNDYASARLDKCPFGDDKKACSKCKVHCYKPEMRARIREIMRYSGPRMLLYHPFDYLKHLLKDKKES